MAKREQGYVVTVKMFVPVNAKDLNDTKAKADAIHKAQQGNDLSGLSEAGADVMKVDHRWTSREKVEAETVHEAAESVEEIAGQARQTDIEESIEQQQERIRAEHEAREAAAEAEEGSEGQQQSDAVEEVASGGTSRRSRARA